MVILRIATNKITGNLDSHTSRLPQGKLQVIYQKHPNEPEIIGLRAKIVEMKNKNKNEAQTNYKLTRSLWPERISSNQPIKE